MESERKLWDQISKYRSSTNDSRLNGTYLCVENIIHCLELFENVVEFLGIFKEIMTEIKDDLTEAIFSRTLTVTEKDSLERIERIPYFELCRQSLEIQEVKSLEFQKINDTFTKECCRLENELKLLNDINKEKENQCLEYKREIFQNLQNINQIQREIQSMQEEKLEMTKSTQNIFEKIDEENIILKNEINRQKAIIDDLKHFKESHEHLNKSFVQACENFEDEDTIETGHLFHKKANLETEIKTITTMNSELDYLENVMLDDFDKRIMGFKEKMMSCINDGDNEDNDQFIVTSILEMQNNKLHFKNEFSLVQIESLMLQNHQAVLINDWSVIEESEAKKELTFVKDLKSSFTIDNRILNKYSVLIYISNDGESFYECKEVRFCESCGNRSVFCPHTYQKEKVIKLPIGSTHMKIQHPEIRINSKYAKFFVTKPFFEIEEKLQINSNEERKQSSRKSFKSSMASTDTETIISFESLLEDFENRTQIKRTNYRKFDEFQILSVIEDFWATIINEDEYDIHQSEVTTILDKLYLFFFDRYAHEKAALLSIYDFFVNIIEMASNSEFIQLFCHVLVGNIDSSTMRYLFHLVDCLAAVDWKSEEDLRTFLSIVHPFLNEDDVDSVVLSYISFSENVFEKSRIFQFFIYNFLKKRDPRFSLVRSEGVDMKTQIPGFYTFNEFQILLESLTSLPNKKLSIRLFKELAIFYTDDGFQEIAPFSRITEIVAFLSFLESVEKSKEILREKYKCKNIKNKNSNGQLKWSFFQLTQLASKLLRNG